MFFPSKYEDLTSCTIVIGAEILKRLKKQNFDVETLYYDVRNKVILNRKGESESISLNQFYNALTFLWTIDALESDGFSLRLK